MATRDYTRHVVSPTEPVGGSLGDEWYNPTTNKIFKRLAVNGTAVSYREIPAALAVQVSGTVVTSSTNTLNFSGYSVSVDSAGVVTINPPTAAAAGSTTQIQFNNAGALAGSASLTWNNSTSTLGVTGFLTTFALSRSGNVNAPTWTTTSPVFNSAASLLTDTNGSGTIALRVGHSLLSPNFASSNLVTITDAANLYVNSNVASTNTTITNNWAIYNSGNMRVTGTLFNDAQITAAGTIVRSGSFSRVTWTVGGGLELSAATITDTNGAGTIATKGYLGVAQPTFASSALTTVTNAASIYVAGDAIAGTNTTLTNTWGIYNAGKIRNVGAATFDNNITQTAGFYYDTITAAGTAAGTIQGDATGLTTSINNITTVALNTGVRLPTAVAGTRMLIRNGGANILRIYPATSAQINALGANIALNLEIGALIEFIAMSTTQWYTTNATFA